MKVLVSLSAPKKEVISPTSQRVHSTAAAAFGGLCCLSLIPPSPLCQGRWVVWEPAVDDGGDV